MHRLVVVAYDGVVPFDVSVPIEVFARVRVDGLPAYDVTVCGTAPSVRAGLLSLGDLAPLDALRDADTVVVPGMHDARLPLPVALLDAVRAAHARGARVVALCSGTFVLAAAGLLDGLPATTHWLGTDLLAATYPAIAVDPSPLYVDAGQVLTSAGAAAALDLCLHVVRCDHGAEVAAEAARLSVVPLVREGGQAQFVPRPARAADDDTLGALLTWIDAHLDDDLDTDTLARRVAMSPRSFLRRFRERTGTTPARWVAAARVRAAQALLESTTRTVEEVGDAVGFGTPATFRQRFRDVVGTSPSHYRRSFVSPVRSGP
ncbi:MAG: helix-turn-helix domain-containing protein [Alphaproteobacteria bacterium]|nr:helix-turn-helix domain-containing protein [Alphaproteobacteria bacterium]